MTNQRFRIISPEYSKSAVDRAGVLIRLGQFTDDVTAVVENWRASHNYILNTFQANMRSKIKGKEIYFAQRLKRKVTIYDKLVRESTIRLSRMNDIAGCRLIFKNISELNEFRYKYHTSRFNHIIQKDIEKYNYITNPKNSGYRGIHDVYSYGAYSHSAAKWDGLSIEIQYRTSVQHAWATAVEIAGHITNNQPKFNRGSSDYIRFFQLSSEILARRYENKNSCLPEMSEKQIIDEIKKLEVELGIIKAFIGLNKATQQFKDSKYVILVYSRLENILNVYANNKSQQAFKKLFELEKQQDLFQDIVLVRADKTETIKNAFRNYFSDAKEFINLIERAID
jgi:putative GTP pyrophosphokinase